MSSLLPVNQDLVTRLLQCRLRPKDRAFVQSLVGRQVCSNGAFDWLHNLRRRHQPQLAALKSKAGVAG